MFNKNNDKQFGITLFFEVNVAFIYIATHISYMGYK